jgi:predicted nucleic acid-binding protein
VGARLALEGCISRGERMVTSAEVLQEILHRYSAIKRLAMVQPAFDALLGVVDEVHPIEVEDVKRARDVMMGLARLSSRDALHVAVMQRYDIPRVMSFDAGFDAMKTIERVS